MRLSLYWFLAYLCLHVTSSSYGQVSKPTVPFQDVQVAVQHIYNLDFAKAQTQVTALQSRYPNHPVIPLLQSLRLYWEFLPIQDHPQQLQVYLGLLQKSIEAIEKTFGSSSEHPEAVFYTIVTRGYLAMCYNYQSELLKAASEAKKAYNALIKGQSYLQQNNEFYFTSGLYNYYIEVYPSKKPIIKPVIWFFKKGSKATGLEQLKVASQKAIISKAEANFYLTHIYLEYENKPKSALLYSKQLHTLYPGNTLYKMIYVETLLHNKEFEQAERLLQSSPLPTQKIYQIGHHLFAGLIEEQLHKNLQKAEEHYLKATKAAVNDQYTGEYPSLALNGLARIAIASNNNTLAKEYYKKSLKTAEYKSTILEANQFLHK